ncbi:HNH endonuclease [Arthrobacter phage Hestia]|uniref:HNH endonuclease n=1 Tax=Arthrobacter phage Hestia TaxID=2419609 RepID=A0A3G3M3H4_9CAUD|nr:HNH endonuclease [Arthrobacter phage Hestia]AYR00965.1 HNH endonuclease [Arthrobacter phage Hestia]
MRICSRRGCPNITAQSLCPQHKAEAERARGNANQRGYGARHQQLRREWTPKVNAGQVDCWRCGHLIQPGTAWDLGHDDSDRTKYRGPEHANQCNRAAAGKSAHPHN